MLSANEVKEAVGALLRYRYPGEPVYTRFLPKKFARPSLYVEFVDKQAEPANFYDTEIVARLRVTRFVDVNAFSDAEDTVADAAADELLELFLGCQIEAGGRSLDVVNVKTTYGADFGGAELTLHYMDETPGAYSREPVPEPVLIEQVYMNGKEIV